ncbi:DUF4298 domain-containing protein [Murdochiella massiliensis]|uniref:DUF4298 domain-containing protein n=1 Tax=Murdochiella massiliensis TaxID=1673723 RepID=UPI00082BFC07|nr:DUF4298 domain-containing protein [Murdochiella massiliensis]
MYKSIGVKPYLMPMPVLIIGTYNEDGTPNAMNAAYGSMRDSRTVSLYVQSKRKTIANILRTKAFTIHLADGENRQEADFVGCVSGNAVPDKVEQTGWSVTKSEDVEAPVFASFPLVLACSLLTYDPVDGHLVGEVQNVAVEETFLDSYGQLHIEEMNLLTYNPAEKIYNIVGDRVGEAFAANASNEEQDELDDIMASQPTEEEKRQALNSNRSERIARVQRMEKVMNELASLQAELNQALDHFESFKEQSDAFDAYYSSRDWMDDYYASSLGIIPEEIDQGVLTEDLPYDVLCENDELGRRMRALAMKLLIR